MNISEPNEQFSLSEFKKDLGKVFYKHKATLSIHHTYDGHWDEEGHASVVVSVDGLKFTLASLWRDYPSRRSGPTGTRW